MYDEREWSFSTQTAFLYLMKKVVPFYCIITFVLTDLIDFVLKIFYRIDNTMIKSRGLAYNACHGVKGDRNILCADNRMWLAKNNFINIRYSKVIFLGKFCDIKSDKIVRAAFLVL